MFEEKPFGWVELNTDFLVDSVPIETRLVSALKIWRADRSIILSTVSSEKFEPIYYSLLNDVIVYYLKCLQGTGSVQILHLPSFPHTIFIFLPASDCVWCFSCYIDSFARSTISANSLSLTTLLKFVCDLEQDSAILWRLGDFWYRLCSVT